MSACPDTGPAATAATTDATVAVVVPVYNDRCGLQCCLAALTASSFQTFSVVVVDDGSTEDIRSVVDAFGYRYLRLEGPGGPARARNHGVRSCDADTIVFVDADVCVHVDTLQRLVDALEGNAGTAAVIGTYDDRPEAPGLFSQYRNLLHRYTHCHSAGDIPTFWCGCGAIRREVFLAYGGLDEERYKRPAIEDIELGMRMTAGGCRILLDPSIECTHLKRWSLLSTLANDVLRRGAPWVVLMLRSGSMTHTLNVEHTQRLSVALMFLTVLLGAAGAWHVAFLAGAVITAGGVVILNRDFYRYLRQCRGRAFVMGAMPLHGLYFLCCGLSVGIGVIQHVYERMHTSSACQTSHRRSVL